MRAIRRALIVTSLLLLALWLLDSGARAIAQQAINELFIGGADTSAAPSIDLFVYAVDGQGNKVDLTGQVFTVEQDGTPVGSVELAGTHTGGTLTLFIIDVPEGVASLIPTIQESISMYGGNPYMVQGEDYVAIYRVDELAATELLGPDTFHNSVQNAFASPLTPSTGSTALVDSVMNILNNLKAIRPEGKMPVHVVLISDGTDVVSTQFDPDDVPRRAAELDLPIHTIWLDNQSLSSDRKQLGQQYLAQIAAGTRGETTNLETADQLTSLWDKISAFREQTILRYTVDELTSGDHRIVVSLADNPAISAETTLNVAPGAPRITLDIPEDSRQLTLSSVDQSVTLSLATLITWPDDTEGELSEAVLMVNGVFAQDIDVTKMEGFEVTLDALVYGANRFQVVALDDQGRRIATPDVVITISEGETVLPDAVQPSGAFDRILDRLVTYGKYIGGCLLIIIVILIFIALFKFVGLSRMPGRIRLPNFLRRVPFLRRYVRQVDSVGRVGYRASRTKREVSRYTPDVGGVDRRKKDSARPSPFLEVLETASQVPRRIDLEALEVRLGRSANQADIVFSNDNTVSRIHATIVQEGGDRRIFDEQSTSGTFINEQRVSEHGLQLTDGDEIRLGAVRLRFRQP